MTTVAKHTNSYATDGLCHNSEPGTFGHECGKPAEWIGTDGRDFAMGFCDHHKQHGHDATDVIEWAAIAKAKGE